MNNTHFTYESVLSTNLWLTNKVKFLKIISFLTIFYLNWPKIWSENPSAVAFLAIFALNFPSGVFKTTNIWKKPIDNTCFLTFFHNVGPNLVLIFPQDHIILIFSSFQYSAKNMLEMFFIQHTKILQNFILIGLRIQKK